MVMFLSIIHNDAFKKIAVLYTWREGAMFAGDISNLDESPMFQTGLLDAHFHQFLNNPLQTVGLIWKKKQYQVEIP